MHEHEDEVEQDNDVISLLKRLQQQVAFLEKKVDLLLAQSQSKPSGERHFSRPRRPFGNPHRGGFDRDRGGFDRDRGSSSGERGFRPERSFDKRRDEEGRGEERPRQERDFRKPYGGGGDKRGFGPKKPFYFKHKGR